MSEPTTNPTEIQPVAAEETADLTSYRVSGHVPLTISVTAASADDATRAAPDAVLAVFAGLAHATLTPDLHAIASPQLVEHPTGADQPSGPRRSGPSPGRGPSS